MDVAVVQCIEADRRQKPSPYDTEQTVAKTHLVERSNTTSLDVTICYNTPVPTFWVGNKPLAITRPSCSRSRVYTLKHRGCCNLRPSSWCVVVREGPYYVKVFKTPHCCDHTISQLRRKHSRSVVVNNSVSCHIHSMPLAYDTGCERVLVNAVQGKLIGTYIRGTLGDG